jgi:hypothetical protein
MESGSHRRRWIWTIIGVSAAVLVLGLMFIAAVPLSSDTLRHRIVESLTAHLDSEVELGDLHLKVFPRLHAEGSALRIRQRGAPEYAPPLISIKRFSVDADLPGLLRRHAAHVELYGLDIRVPPSDERDFPGPPDSAGMRDKRESNGSADYKGVVIDTLESTDARLVIIPTKTDKAPKVWAIHRLRMRNVGVDQAMPFEAALTNAIPPGQIDTSGSFGPWRNEAPGNTPLNGTFTFSNADLSVFHGISGMVSAHGTYGGTLASIDVNGETDTPDFTIKVGGHSFALHTKYHSIVDGTNGDTRLERIDGTFLQSSLVAKGVVLDAPPGGHGRIVRLDIQMDRARIEDIMYMAVRTSKPPMTGGLKLTTKFLLPPGQTDVADRLRLDGRFAIARARFTNIDVQGKIDALSHRGRGRAPETRKDGVLSDFQGRFTLANGGLELPELEFAVPGAKVQLVGQYALRPQTLDFRGTMFMDAKISETQSGFKSLLLKVVDPIFKREGGGSAVPFRIGGTRRTPAFRLDYRRLFRRGDTP